MADDANYRDLMAHLEAVFARGDGEAQFAKPVDAPSALSAGAGTQMGFTSGSLGMQGDRGSVTANISGDEVGTPAGYSIGVNAGPVGYQQSRPMQRGAPAQHSFRLNLDPEDVGTRLQAILNQSPGGRRSYGVGTGGEGWGAQAVYDPHRKALQISGGLERRFAHGGSVPGYAEGGLMERLRNLLKGEEYQSQGGKTVNDGQVNWGDSDSAADFFRADKARTALDKARSSVANIERASAAPLPPRRPMPEAAPAPDRGDFSRTIPGAQPPMQSERFMPMPSTPYGALNRIAQQPEKPMPYSRWPIASDRYRDVNDWTPAEVLGLMRAKRSMGETVTGYAHGGVVRGYAEGGFRDPNDPLGGLAVDPNDPRQWLQFGGRDEGDIPTGVPLALPLGEPISQAAQGIADIPGSIGSYIAETSQKPDPSQRMAEDIRRFGGAFADQAMSSPMEFAKTVGGFIPGIGEAISAYDAKNLYGDLQKAEAEGDAKKADTLRQFYGLATAGAIPGVGIASRVAGKVKQGAAHEASNLAAKATEIFGKTRDIREAGYVMPDGSMLDFTGRHQVTNDYARIDDFNRPVGGKRDWMSGERNVDHREVSDLIDAPQGISGTDAMTQFMDQTNAIRNKPGIGFESVETPTDQQLKALVGGHNKSYRGEPMMVELSDRATGNVIASTEFEKPTVETVKKWFDENVKNKSDYIPHDNPERAKNFANWFGESKMVDDNNKPLVLYHGSKDDIGYFNLHHPNRKDAGWLGTGVYLTDDPDLASIYAKHQKSGPQGPNVMPLYAKLENPFYAPLEFKEKIRNIENSQGKEAARDAADAMTRDLQDKGYDGVVFNYENNKGREVVVFDPAGVKSSTGNNGMFNPKSDVLNKAQGGSVRGYATGGPADDSIEALYNKYTGRSADPEGRAYWQSQLAGMAPEEQDAAFLKGANAAYAANAAAPGPVSDAQIKNLYQQYAGREADQGGLEYWKQKAAAPGATYADLSNQFRQDVASAGSQDQVQTVKAPPFLEKFDYENFDNPLDAGLDYLKRTLGDKAAAALYGNFNTESYANPQQLQTAGGPNGRPLFDRFTNMPLGMGLAQWSPERQNNLYKFADKYGVDPNSTEGQLRFAVNELTTNPSYSKWLNRLQQPNVNVAGATQILGKRYEAPARLQQTIAERKAAADLFSRYMNKGTLTPEEQARIASIKGGVKDPMFAAKLAARQAPTQVATKPATNNQLPNSADILGDTGFNPVVDTSVNDRIMQDANDRQQQLIQNSLNYNGTDPNSLFNSYMNYPTTSFSSGGVPGGMGGADSFTGLTYMPLSELLGQSGQSEFSPYLPYAEGGSVGYAEGGSFQPMFEGDSETLQARAKQLAKQAYSDPRSLSSEDMKEWNLLAGRYNLPFSAQNPMPYEDEMEQRNNALERNLSAKERRRTYARGGAVDAYDPAEIDAIAAQIRGAA
jgi:hypothetical protein